MQKPLALSLALCLGLTGCQVFQRSETWDTVVKVRPGNAFRDPDPSHAYAARLHEVLASRGIEHKVVVYQYRYQTRLRDEAVGTRTAVIYRDPTNANYPWWLKDERSSNPVWLPNGELDRQVSFYLRRKAQVIEEKNYPAKASEGKAMLAFAAPAPKLRQAAAPEPRSAVTKLKPATQAPAPIVTRKAAQAPVVAEAQPAPVRHIEKPAPTTQVRKFDPVTFLKTSWQRISRQPAAQAPAPKIAAPTPATPTAPVAKAKPRATSPARPALAEASPKPIIIYKETLPPVAARSSGSGTWNPPAVLDQDQQPAETAPRDRHLEKLFRAKHGTDYNPFSAVDRRKMAGVQQAANRGSE